MVRNEHEIVIAASPDRIFGLISDLEEWRRWRPAEGELERTTPGPVGVGTVWKVSARVMGEPMTATVAVTDYQPGVRFGLRTSGSIEADEWFTLVPVAGGTRLSMVLELADPQLAEPARQQWDSDLRRLQELLETER